MTSVQPLRTPKGDPKEEIKAEIDDFFRAFEAKDVDRIMSHYAPDVVAFDMMPPLEYKGRQAWEEVWKKSFPMMKGDIKGELKDLKIDVDGDIAICHALSHFMLKGEENMDMWFRWTAGLRRIGGKWLVTHEHNSVPGDPQTGKALMDLKPE